MRVAGLLILMLIAGCRPAGETKEAIGGEKVVAPVPVVFRENELALGVGTRGWIERLHRTTGTHFRREGAYQHVLIALGERPTGGFRVELEAVTEHPDYILIEAVEIAPGPEDMVTQVLTYPYLFLSVETQKEIRVSIAFARPPGPDPGRQR